jgi:sugar/nucleoside kinase (ribokinase family)
LTNLPTAAQAPSAGAADRAPSGRATETLLMGTISLDHYLASGDVLPGGGVLNMAWHWRQLGRWFEVLTRVGAVDGAPIERFLDRHAIQPASRAELAAPGRSSAVDIEILPDRQPWMDNFVPGVWEDYRLTGRERAVLSQAKRLHVVLVEGAIAELDRLAHDDALGSLAVSADFLGFRHYTVDRLAQTMRHVDLGFIGWPGDEADPAVEGMRAVAYDLARVLIVTLGSTAVRIFDGRDAPSDRRFPVQAVEVGGTTLGCGDAFIAWYLDELWRSGDHAAAVARGMMGGAAATSWPRPLPDGAYAPPPPSADPPA